MATETIHDLDYWLERLRAKDPLAVNAFLEGCQDRLRALVAKIFRDFQP